MNSFDIIVNAIDKASKVFDDIGRSGSDIGNKVDGGVSKASGALGKLEGAGGKAASALGGVAKIAGGFVLAQGLMAAPGALQAISGAATSLQQNAQKATIVLGEALGSVETWAKESAANMGLTKREAVTLAAGMSDLLKPMGFTSQQAATMSTEVLDLSGALAEWSGGQYDAAGVADLLQDALLGETDGLKALGISLNAEEIATRAATLTGEEFKNMTDAQKQAIATQQLILEKSTDAQTAYANSQDDAASKQARATAKINEAKEALILQLAPAVAAGIEGFSIFAGILATVVVPALSTIIGSVISFVGYLAPLASMIADNMVPTLLILGPALIAVGVAIMASVVPAMIAKATALWTAVGAWIALNASMLPIIAIALAIGVAIAALYLAWQSNFLGIQDITRAVIDFVRPYIEGAINGIVTLAQTVFPILLTVVETVFNGVRTAVETVMPAVQTIVETTIGVIRSVFETVFPVIQTVVETVFGAIRLVFETVFPIIQTIVQTYIDIYRTIFETGFGVIRTVVEVGLGIIQAVFETVLPIIQTIVETVFGAIVGIVQTQIGIFQTAIELGVNAAKAVFDTVFVPIQGIVSDVFNTITGLIDSVFQPAMDAIGTGVDRAKAFFDDTFVAIQGVVDDVFGTIVDLIYTLWTSGAVEDIKSGVQAIIDAFTGIYDTMYDFGADMVQGLIDGAESLFGILEGVWDKISGIADKIIAAKNLISSPSKLLRKRGNQMMDGLILGTKERIPEYEALLNGIASKADGVLRGRGGAGSGIPSGTSTSSSGGGSAPAGSGGGSAGGGSKSPNAPGTGTLYSADQGMRALEQGASFIGCSWSMVGTTNDNGLFLFPDGKKHWRSTKFCRDGRNGPNSQELRSAARTVKRKEDLIAQGVTIHPDGSYRMPGSAPAPTPEPITERAAGNIRGTRAWDRIQAQRAQRGRKPQAAYQPVDTSYPGQQGNTYNIYGMMVGDVQREIERAERKLATNWSIKSGV